eukprot:SAG11_NODE_4678_length_1809_cov_1.433918_2_plen_165_part_00
MRLRSNAIGSARAPPSSPSWSISSTGAQSFISKEEERIYTLNTLCAAKRHATNKPGRHHRLRPHLIAPGVRAAAWWAWSSGRDPRSACSHRLRFPAVRECTTNSLRFIHPRKQLSSPRLHWVDRTKILGLAPQCKSRFRTGVAEHLHRLDEHLVVLRCVVSSKA